jgi:hypothetical protein
VYAIFAPFNRQVQYTVKFRQKICFILCIFYGIFL